MNAPSCAHKSEKKKDETSKVNAFCFDAGHQE